MIEESTILDKLLTTEVKGDLLALFHKNPGLIDTQDGVARRIGRKPVSIEADVKDLVDMGVLKTLKIGRHVVILLDRKKDRDIQAAIANHLKSLTPRGRG